MSPEGKIGWRGISASDDLDSLNGTLFNIVNSVSNDGIQAIRFEDVVFLVQF